MGMRPRRALVTGASSGIGAAVAEALAVRGCELVLVGRDEARLTEVCRATGGRPVVADLRSPTDLERAAAVGEDADLLVNNAGVGWAGRLPDMASTTVHDLVAANLSAPVELTRLLLPGMMRRERGHIAFVSSIACVGVAGEATYAATKAGIRAFAASVRAEAAPAHVGVTTVLPGAVATPFFQGRGQPYDRRFPRQVSARSVAAALASGVEHDRHEVFVPAWLGLAARVHGLMPATFHRMARRFG